MEPLPVWSVLLFSVATAFIAAVLTRRLLQSLIFLLGDKSGLYDIKYTFHPVFASQVTALSIDPMQLESTVSQQLGHSGECGHCKVFGVVLVFYHKLCVR